MEDIAPTILEGYELPNEGLHGPRHWIRVSRVGLQLAKATPGADQEVAHLFALFHDSRRENEDTDPEHGLRGTELAASMRDTHLLHLSDAQSNCSGMPASTTRTGRPAWTRPSVAAGTLIGWA